MWDFTFQFGLDIFYSRPDISLWCSSNVGPHISIRTKRVLFETRHFNAVLFQRGAIIVAEQVRVFGRNTYACKKPHLRPLFLRCVNLGRELHGLGCQWSIRHIYKEYNQVADSLANQAIDQGSCDWIRVN